MEPDDGEVKICRKFSFIPQMVYIGMIGHQTTWIWFREYYAVYEYNDNGSKWNTGWELKRQFILW